MTELKSFIEESVKAVDAVLDVLLPPEDTAPERLNSAMRWSVFGGGKRFRPVLTYAAGKSLNVEREKLDRTAAAIEMIHSYSLIHDDLPAMDNDDLRRGRATCHRKFDEATAILAGDALQNLAFQSISDDENLSDGVKINLIRELTYASNAMVAGQQMDIDAENRIISAVELETIHRSKTGALIRFSGCAPAIAAQCDRETVISLGVFAESLGLLFQITDDLLDVTQTTETLGKTAGKDISAMKATYPKLFGIDGAKDLAISTHRAAVDELSKIDGDTTGLVQIADYILFRRK